MYVNTTSLSLNVRNAPNGAVVGSLKKGTQVTVYAEQDGWSKIGEGKWVSSQYLADNAPSTPQPTTKTMYVKTSGSNLNIRNNPNGSVVGSLKNGSQVNVLEESNGWSRIGAGQWVSSTYLSENKSSGSISRNTAGQTKRFKSATTIYSNSNLSGTKYNYKANTSVTILQNTSSSVDKVKVAQTGRIGYVSIQSYK